MKKCYSQIIQILVFGILLLPFASALAAGSDLDDISIQVIGLDEIPEEALERIPLPKPNVGGLTDIRENILLNRPEPAQAAIEAISAPVSGPPDATGGSSPPPSASSPPPATP